MEAKPGSVIAAVVLGLGLVAGGAVFAARNGGDPIDPAALVSADIVSHAANGLVPLVPEDLGRSALLLPLRQKGAEPTLGITRAGTLLVTGFTDSDVAKMWRSTNDGRAWTSVVFPAERVDFDPYLWVDPDTDRVFSAPLYKECTNLMWSDDEGKTWEFTPTSVLAGCPYTDHDHQSVTTGAPRGVTTNGYHNVVYYSYQSASVALPGAYVSRSLDGGSTWSTGGGVKVFDADCQGGLAGAPVAAPDGTLYLPKPGCRGILVGVSEDSGATWRSAEIDMVGIQGGSSDRVAHALQTAPVTPNPAVAVDDNGTAYVTWTGADAIPYLSHSTDLGRTWSVPVRIAPPEIRASVFTAAVAGGAGRVALAYLGTVDEAESAHNAPAATRWNLYVTITQDGSSDDPRFTTLRATPEADPVQRGCIWQAGGEAACRNLRDYISLREHEGRVFVAYADGCANCTSAEKSRRADAHIAVIQGAPSLRDGRPLGSY